MSDLPNLDAAHAAEPNMADLRHTWEPWGRYTCPACGEALLKRDPNDLCPAKVALRLATVDALTRERDDMRHGFESCARLATWLSDNRAALNYDGCGMAGDEAIVLIQRLVGERDEAVMSAAIGEAVVAAFRGEEVSDFMQSFAPVMEAQNIGYTVRLLEGDRDALWRVVKDACGWLRVTDDDEKDWPKLPAYAKQIIAERDEARAALFVKPAVVVTMGAGWTEERLRLEREIDRKGEVIESLTVERDEAHAALTEAEAAGWRRGMEEAAKVCELRAGDFSDTDIRARELGYTALHIRSTAMRHADAKVTT